MASTPGPNALRYLQSVLAAIEADLGAGLPPGTTLVPTDDRDGSSIATCYPFDGRTAVWCDPARGAAIRGIGLNRVLDGPLVDPLAVLDALTIRPLVRDDADDVALIAALRDAVSDEDAEDAHLDLGDLDPHIFAAVDSTGAGGRDRVLALASARLAEPIPFDDIAVITHPQARRQGFGAACVHRLVSARRASGTPAMYRCEANNIGSGLIAERLGFDLVQTVGSVRFGA